MRFSGFLTGGGGRIKHVRVLLGVPTLQILRFKKKKKFEKANKARTCFIRLFELFGKFFQSQFFFDFFFAQEVILLHFRANPGLWWGIYGKMDKISATKIFTKYELPCHNTGKVQKVE